MIKLAIGVITMTQHSIYIIAAVAAGVISAAAASEGVAAASEFSSVDTHKKSNRKNIYHDTDEVANLNDGALEQGNGGACSSCS